MDPMTRWEFQGKADDPWNIVHVVKNGYTDGFAEFVEVKGEDMWSLDAEHGSCRG